MIDLSRQSQLSKVITPVITGAATSNLRALPVGWGSRELKVATLPRKFGVRLERSGNLASTPSTASTPDRNRASNVDANGRPAGYPASTLKGLASTANALSSYVVDAVDDVDAKIPRCSNEINFWEVL